MTIGAPQRERFIHAFIQAVIEFQRTDSPQGIVWDARTESFEIDAVEPGMALSGVDFYVGDTWAHWMGSESIPSTADIAGGQLLMDGKRLSEQLRENLIAGGKVDWMIELMGQMVRARESGTAHTGRSH